MARAKREGAEVSSRPASERRAQASTKAHLVVADGHTLVNNVANLVALLAHRRLLLDRLRVEHRDLLVEVRLLLLELVGVLLCLWTRGSVSSFIESE